MRFRTDLDELEDVVRRLTAAHVGLDELAVVLDRQLGLLHEAWGGAAADAHVDAQAAWDQGFADMRAALGQLRSAAEAGQVNYTRAADTNVTMWRQLG